MNRIVFNFAKDVVGIYREGQNGEQDQEGLSNLAPEILHVLGLDSMSPTVVVADFEAGTVTADGVEYSRPGIAEETVWEAAGLQVADVSNISRIVMAMSTGKISDGLSAALISIECDSRESNPQVTEFLRKLEAEDGSQ